MDQQLREQWQAENLANIKGRLFHHLDDKNLAKIIPSEIQGVFVRITDDVMELYCYDPETRNLSDIMSRVSLHNPLDQIAAYSQVMFLSYIWCEISPEKIYIAGFGGGRLAMAFHHHNPIAQIDGSDFDPAILEVASSHFGIDYDHRYSVNAADSYEDFDSRNGPYDLIIIDVFSSSGAHASHLASKDFFEKCKAKLSRHGVVAINLIEQDLKRAEKIANLADVFSNLVEWCHQGSHIVFASENTPSIQDIVQRADVFEKHAGLNYPYSERARELQIVDRKTYNIA